MADRSLLRHIRQWFRGRHTHHIAMHDRLTHTAIALNQIDQSIASKSVQSECNDAKIFSQNKNQFERTIPVVCVKGWRALIGRRHERRERERKWRALHARMSFCSKCFWLHSHFTHETCGCGKRKETKSVKPVFSPYESVLDPSTTRKRKQKHNRKCNTHTRRDAIHRMDALQWMCSWMDRMKSYWKWMRRSKWEILLRRSSYTSSDLRHEKRPQYLWMGIGHSFVKCFLFFARFRFDLIRDEAREETARELLHSFTQKTEKTSREWIEEENSKIK